MRGRRRERAAAGRLVLPVVLLLGAAGASPEARAQDAVSEQDRVRWIERVAWPSTLFLPTSYDLSTAEVGIDTTHDFGFPDDAEEALAQAEERVRAGDPDPHFAHQGFRAALALKKQAQLDRFAPLAVNGYAQQADGDAAEQALLALEDLFHRLWLLTGQPDFFQKAMLASMHAQERRPNDLSLRLRRVGRLRIRYLQGPSAETLRDVGVELDAVEEDHPDRAELAFFRFLADNEALMFAFREAVEDDPDAADVVELLRGVQDAAERALQRVPRERDPAIAFGVRTQWLALELSLTAHAYSEDLEPRPSPHARKRLEEHRRWVREPAAVRPKLLQQAARVVWTLGAFHGDAEGWSERLEALLELGIDRNQALRDAAIGFHESGSAEAARAVGEELAQDGEAASVATRAWIERSEGRWSSALELLESIEQPEDAILLTRAVLLLRLGRIRDARLLLDERPRAELPPDLRCTWTHAEAVIEAVEGRFGPAAALLLQVGPDPKERGDALRSLQELGPRLKDDEGD